MNLTLEHILEVAIGLVRTLAILFIGIRAGAGLSALGMEAFTPLAIGTPALVLVLLAIFPFYTVWNKVEELYYVSAHDA